jgi:ABC-type Mn2+/Zn2+ transport system ATPase subunit
MTPGARTSAPTVDPVDADARHAPNVDATPAVELSHIVAGYGDRPVLDDLSLVVAQGALLAIVGPNGGGKSTLLKLIAGLLEPWSGDVRIFGGPAGAAARRVSYVTQAELVDWTFPVSVWDVAMMGRTTRIGPLWTAGADDREAVRAALERVGMEDHASTAIGALSGGQRRRAFLARALAAEPDLYLLDEPVTGVDVPTQEALIEVLAGEAGHGRTVISTTHDLAAAQVHFPEVVALNRRIVAAGPPDEVLRPEILAEAYGGHLISLPGGTTVLDDAHHHDAAPPGEVHHHDEPSHR